MNREGAARSRARGRVHPTALQSWPQTWVASNSGLHSTDSLETPRACVPAATEGIPCDHGHEQSPRARVERPNTVPLAGDMGGFRPVACTAQTGSQHHVRPFGQQPTTWQSYSNAHGHCDHLICAPARTHTHTHTRTHTHTHTHTHIHTHTHTALDFLNVYGYDGGADIDCTLGPAGTWLVIAEVVPNTCHRLLAPETATDEYVSIITTRGEVSEFRQLCSAPQDPGEPCGATGCINVTMGVSVGRCFKTTDSSSTIFE
jgi:hypothetical protein